MNGGDGASGAQANADVGPDAGGAAVDAGAVTRAQVPADSGMTSGLPPLVPLRVELDAAERRRTARHVLLDGFGLDAQIRLGSARVLVVGAGGLGSPVLQYLAAAGVGTLGIVDDDAVTPSNLQRQVLHGAADIGVRKTTSAAAALRALRPEADVVEYPRRLTADNADELMTGYDVVVDACDTFATRYLIGDAATRLRLPVVWGTVLGWDGQVSVWWSAAPDGRALTYRDVFGDQPAEGDSCETAGVLGPACGVVGTTMAVETLKLLTGTGSPALGRLLTYDARTSTWDEIPLTTPCETEPPPAEIEPTTREVELTSAEVVSRPREVERPAREVEHPFREVENASAEVEPSAGEVETEASTWALEFSTSAGTLSTSGGRGSTSAGESSTSAGESSTSVGQGFTSVGAAGGGSSGGRPELVVDVGLEAVVRGAVWVRLEDLAAGRLPDVLLDHPLDAPLVVVCEQGLRSRGAAGVLRDDGWVDVRSMTYADLVSRV